MNQLEPKEPAKSGQLIWDRNLNNFLADIRAAHVRKSEELSKYAQWGDRINRWVQEIVYRIVEAVKQFIRFARFSTTMILMSNYYIWRHGINLVNFLS